MRTEEHRDGGAWVRLGGGRRALLFIGPPVAALGVALAMLAGRSAPVQPGTPMGFWSVAATDPHDAMVAPDGYAYYAVQGCKTSPLYRVPLPTARQGHDDAATELAANVDELRGRRIAGVLEDWHFSSSREPADLIDLSAMAVEETLCRNAPAKADDLVAYLAGCRAYLEHRVERIDRYPFTLAFEWVFLSALVAFVAWPWITGRRPLVKAVPLALLPCLLMLPAWLGYATSTFTSAGPGGGVLYPQLVKRLPRLTWEAVDMSLLMHVPPVLEPLAISRGSAIAITGMGMPGPSFAVAVGIVVLVAAWRIERVRERRLKAA